MANEEYKKFIREKEGKKLTAYKPAPNAKPGDVDYEKFYTIGYGHYGSDVTEGQTITEAQAEELLDKDVTKRLIAIRKAIKDFDSFPEDTRVDLFASWYRGGLSGSKETIKLINKGDYEAASKEFLDNNEYRTTTLDGIKDRMETTSKAIKSLGTKSKQTTIQPFADEESQAAFFDIMANSSIKDNDYFLKQLDTEIGFEKLSGPWRKLYSNVIADTKMGSFSAGVDKMISEEGYEEPERYSLQYKNGGFSASMLKQDEYEEYKLNFRKKF